MSFAAVFNELKAYVRFGVEDEVALGALRDHARPSFDRIAREFYERAREHEDAHSVFESEAQIQRLHGSLVAWLDRILSGPYDESYCAKSSAIGMVHVRVGLPQRFMFAAMTLFRIQLQQIALASLGAAAGATCDALARILDIELALMNEAYRCALLERVVAADREREHSAMAKLERAERRYVQAVDLASALIVGLDSEGHVVLFNREAERLTGYASDEIRGKSFAERAIMDEDACGFRAAWDALSNGSAPKTRRLPINCTLRSRSGKLRDVAGHMVRAPDDETGLAMYVTGRDITNERAAEARLRQTEKLAAVGTLAAGLAHEIRNPLNGANLHLTFLQRALSKAAVNGEIGEAVQVVSGEIARLSQLVNEFLDFARPRELVRTHVSIQDLCKRVSALIHDEDGDGPRLRIELPDTPMLAELDDAKMQQVLINLLQNALDASSASEGGEVVLRALRKPRHVVLEVQDDGAGIHHPEAPIFDAFYSTKANGTGLGLAIVHRIVSDHDGRIDVESLPGATTFRVTLPLRSPTRGPDSSVTPPPVTQEHLAEPADH